MKQKHNEAIAYNVQLREQIDILRKEKNIFDEIHENLQAELLEKTKEYDKIKEKSEKALKEIMLAKRKLYLAKQNSYKEQKDLEKEYQSIYKLLDKENQDDRLREMREKMRKEVDFKKSAGGSTFSQFKKEIENSNTNQPKKNPDKFYITQYEGADSPKRGGLKKARTITVKEPFNLEQLKEEVKVYQEKFEKLKEETAAQNINEMVDYFVENEDNNYSLFNYLNVLGDEVLFLFSKL